MKDKTKNTITNLIGLVLLGINIYMFYWGELELTSFLVLLCVSLALFLLKEHKQKNGYQKDWEKYYPNNLTMFNNLLLSAKKIKQFSKETSRINTERYS